MTLKRSPDTVSSTNCASRITAAGGGGGGGGGVAAVISVSAATTASGDQCGGRRLQQQSFDDAHPARARVQRPCVHGCSDNPWLTLSVMSGATLRGVVSVHGKKKKAPKRLFRGNRFARVG